MGSVSRVCRAVAAAGGFLAGYLWAVVGWARGLGMTAGPAEIETFVAGGVFLATLHALLVGAFFVPLTPPSRALGLRIVVAPATFTVSFVIGALGIRWALGMVG
ncbi:MAG: hypothetical protein HZB55_06225 [Deltaproteobacteria bacterium]|nr:hypothetical protein [Deltaproteobacteria bacterium]